jgi:hypothetical protein
VTLRGKTVITVGPWTGGVNTRDQDAASMDVKPNQLRFVKNLNILDSGILESRLGCRKVLSTAPIYGGTGISLVASLIEGGSQYAVLAKLAAGPTSSFFFTRDPDNVATGWTAIAIAQTGTFTDAVQYNGVMYFVQSVGGAGTGQSRTALASGGWTAQPNIPKGDQAFLVRDRMFVIDWVASKVYWSKATDPTTWTPPDGGFVLVSPGDGENITKVVFINNSIYIFKRNKTFLFSFNADPAIDGQLTPLSTVRGAHDALVYNNEIYLVNDQSLFKLVNNYFTDLGVLADFYAVVGPDQLFDPLCRLFIEAGDKLVIGPTNIVNPTNLWTHYAMNLKTGAWSYRTYDDANIQPQAPVNKKYLTWRNSQTVAGASVGNIYLSATNVVSYTKFKSWNITNISNNTLDVNTAEHTISPEYSFVTHEIIPENSYGEWKRCFFIMGRYLINIDTLTDNLAIMSTRLGPEIFNIVQSQALPATGSFLIAQKEGKIPFASFRFKSLILSFQKASKDCGTVIAKDPTNTNIVRIQNLQVIISSNRQQLSEAVNA